MKKAQLTGRTDYAQEQSGWQHDAPSLFESRCRHGGGRRHCRPLYPQRQSRRDHDLEGPDLFTCGIGTNTFKTWCGTIKEKTGGELDFKPFAAKEVVGDFELIDGVKNGVLEAVSNSFTVYWSGKMPAAAFLSSYLMGLRYPHEWDIFFSHERAVSKRRAALYAKQGLQYVGRIHHGPNIIHSKKPIRSIEDFKDLKLRVPGGMIAEGFAAIGAKTTLLPGGEVFSALEKGTIEAADYTGPAVNWDLGFQQVTKYIWTGPRGLMSVYQPVDLMDFAVNTSVWNKLSPKMKQWVEDEIEVYCRIHFSAIQKADMEAWKKFTELPAPRSTGSQWRILINSSALRFRSGSNGPTRTRTRRRSSSCSSKSWKTPTVGYIDPEMYKGLTLDL